MEYHLQKKANISVVFSAICTFCKILRSKFAFKVEFRCKIHLAGVVFSVLNVVVVFNLQGGEGGKPTGG